MLRRLFKHIYAFLILIHKVAVGLQQERAMVDLGALNRQS
jgi:hypothetical protein